MKVLTALARRLGLGGTADAQEVNNTTTLQAPASHALPELRLSPLKPAQIRSRLYDTLLANHRRMLSGGAPVGAPVRVFFHRRRLTLEEAQEYALAFTLSNAIELQEAVFHVGPNTSERRGLRHALFEGSDPVALETYKQVLRNYLTTNGHEPPAGFVIGFAGTGTVVAPVHPSVERSFDSGRGTQSELIMDLPTRSQTVHLPTTMPTSAEGKAEFRFLYDLLYDRVQQNHGNLMHGIRPVSISEHPTYSGLTIFSRLADLQQQISDMVKTDKHGSHMLRAMYTCSTKDPITYGNALVEYIKDSAVLFDGVGITWKVNSFLKPSRANIQLEVDGFESSIPTLRRGPTSTYKRRIEAAKFSAQWRENDAKWEAKWGPDTPSPLQYKSSDAGATTMEVDSCLRKSLYGSEMEVDDDDMSKTANQFDLFKGPIRPLDCDISFTSSMSADSVQDTWGKTTVMRAPEECAFEAMKFSLQGRQMSDRLAGREPETPIQAYQQWYRDWIVSRK